MKRVYIFGLKSCRKKILELLQRRQAIEVIDAPDDQLKLTHQDTTQQISMFDRNISLAQSALSLLDEYAPVKKPLFAPRRDMSTDEFGKKIGEFDKILKKCTDLHNLAKTISDCKAANIRIEDHILALEPWLNLDIPMNFKGTQTTSSFIGTIPSQVTLEQIIEQLPDLPQEADINIISASREQTCIHVLAHKSCAEEIEGQLRKLGFSRPGWSLSHLICEEKIQRLNKEINQNIKKIEQSKNDIIAMGKSRNDIEFVIDYLTLRKEKYQVISKLAMTQSVFMLEGWIPEKRLGKLINELNKYDVYVEVSNPKEDEQAPVAFQNGSFVNPVENLTESYSMPGPEDIDPNPFMAFFYYLLFGLMLSDAGYGILMALASGYFSFIAKVEQKTKRLMRMFFFCSLSTIFWGAIFGSWFGDLFTRISTNFFNPPSDATIAIWMDPLKDPMTLIIFSLVVGVIHIIVGLIAKFYGLCKHGKIIDALCDSGLHIIMLLGLLTMAGGIALMPETKLGIIGGYTAAGAFILAVLTSARSAKGIGKLTSIFSSIYNILTGYLSDILSYSRLMALCLTTGAIGMVVNQLGTMMGNNIFGYIFFAVIFVFGHAINLGINALGTYVHCNRLQYVEFFKQFYEGGGKAFKPFAVNTKYVKFREEN